VTIVEFLEARIADDERTPPEGDDPVAVGRWLREVMAKRALTRLHAEIELTYWPNRICGGGCMDVDVLPIRDPLGADCYWQPPATFPCPTVRTLASVWADHPDYDQAWAVA
jgi:uncharacterized protein DUF6221